MGSVISPSSILAVFVGGGLGSLGRYLLGVFINKNGNLLFPWHTLMANVIACFVIGLVFSVFLLKTDYSQNIKLLLSVGFCGGLSTFSTFSLEVITLINNHNFAVAAGYSLISFIVCLLATVAGLMVGGFIGQRI